MMKRVIVGVLAIAVTGVAGTVSAQTKVRSWDDLSWWAQSEATPNPVKDSRRSGYWWWPSDPVANADDGELWGNRGVVYGMYSPPQPPPPPPVKAPPMTQAPKPKRSVPVLNHVLFDFDKSVLKAEGKKEVDRLVGMMKQNPGDDLVIEGHTCNVGEADYNLGLGQRRADAVRKYMIDNGMAARRIQTVSKGETEPAVPNDTPANRKLNRRVIFKYSIGDR